MTLYFYIKIDTDDAVHVNISDIDLPSSFDPHEVIQTIVTQMLDAHEQLFSNTTPHTASCYSTFNRPLHPSAIPNFLSS
jgi:hypothetical protein